jgi:hypothetical protein
MGTSMKIQRIAGFFMPTLPGGCPLEFLFDYSSTDRVFMMDRIPSEK